MSPPPVKRIYEALIQEHLAKNRQMIFLAGPRQVGKTTLSLLAKKFSKNIYYLNWDNLEYQHLIIRGPKYVIQKLGLDELASAPAIIIFDELHKFSRWKQFLKGFFDTYGARHKLIVTGSAKLDIYKRIGDSLMGRYFLYRIHPLSVAELISPIVLNKEIRPPKKIAKEKLKNLLHFGGFPEPFIHADKKFHHKWLRFRYQQTFHEDIRSLTEIQEMAQLEMLAGLLKARAGQLINYSDLARDINVSVPTIKRWIDSLSAFYYSFTIKPWFKNVGSSLKKQPKIYLWDWSDIEDSGAKNENFVASHLLKAVNFWTDCGMGNYDLFFVRDKQKREVDFLVTKNQKPWFLVEVKTSKQAGLSQSLLSFQKQTEAEHAFQVVFDMEVIEEDCFKFKTPIIVPVETLLSQLV